jgi:hypothetical protein
MYGLWLYWQSDLGLRHTIWLFASLRKAVFTGALWVGASSIQR